MAENCSLTDDGGGSDISCKVESWCQDPLFDKNVSWDTQDPDVSVCLQKTFLIWLPCAGLWAAAPFQAWLLYKTKSSPIPHSALNIVRTVLACGLALLAAADLGYWASRAHYTVDILDPLVRLLTWLLVIVQIQAERVKGYRSSGLLWTFWGCYLIFNLPRLYSQIRREYLLTTDRTELISNSLSCFLVLAHWLLGFLRDVAPVYQEEEEDKRPCPEPLATLPSALFFSWFDTFAWAGYKKAITKDQLWDLNKRDRCSTVVPIFNAVWEPQLRAAQLDQRRISASASYGAAGDAVKIETADARLSPRERLSIFMPLVRSFGVSFAAGSLLKFFHDILVFASPILLQKIIQFSESDEPMWRGILYSVLLLLFASAQTVFLSQYFYRMYLVGMWSKSSLIAAIYRKSLRVASSARKETTSGEIVNLMAVDCQRIADMTPYLNMLWSSPLQIIVAIIMLYQILGPSVFAGLAVMIIMIPLNGFIAAKTRKLQVSMMKEKDIRVKKMNELLQGMKILKLYAWEQSFMDDVERIRNNEIHIMLKMAYLSAGTSFIWTCAPFVVSLVTFATFVLSSPENILDSQKAFTSLALFNILRFPLSMLPMMITSAVQASVSVKRINQFMRSDELDPSLVQRTAERAEKGGDAVRVTNGCFRWETAATTAAAAAPKQEANGASKTNGAVAVKSEEDKEAGDKKDAELEETQKLLNGSAPTEIPREVFSLQDINIRVPCGSLCAVVGSVGAGKSSLLSALLGEMDMEEGGQVELAGRLAYVSQQAWIQNARFKDNILFGNPMEEEAYKQVVEDCALTTDIEILPNGHDTEIGDKGINLSGGQKARVSLARAVYSNADIYLMDDPLSAVDSHVGKHIFERVLGPQGCLKDKTRVLVTHGVTFLPQMDQIIVLKNGVVSEVGTYRELLEQKGDFADFLIQYLSEKGTTDADLVDAEDAESADVVLQIKHELESRIGAVELDRQLSRARTESECNNAGDMSAPGSQQRRGSDESTRSGGALSNKSEQRSSPRKQTTSPGRRVSGDPHSKTPPAEKKPAAAGQYQDEKMETGEVSWRIYYTYFHNMGYLLFSACVFLYTVYQVFTTLANVWLSYWSDNSLPFVNKEEEIEDSGRGNETGWDMEMMNGTAAQDYLARRDLYLGVYGAMGFLQALAAVVAGLLLFLSTLAGAKTLHSKTLLRLMHCPMAFFDTTPQGRIINRFSKDVDVLDTTMPMILRGWLTCLLQVVATFLVIMATTPLAVIFIFVVLVGYYFVQRVYVASSRQLKRLESTSKSPIYSHFGETIAGVTVIRAYGLEQRFIAESERRVDENQKATFAGVISNRWLAVRLETVGNCIIFAAALFAVLSREQLSGGWVGLSVSFALQVTQTLNWLVRMASEVETNIVAVERLEEYSQLEMEAAWDRTDTCPPEDWPSEGRIKLDNYSTRYRPGLDLVLRNVSVDFRGGERVGIVGRTGAGKSSLTLALFRIIEPVSGSIIIDDVNVGQLGLHRLRSRLTIIPQDPVLFSGTLRHNLDPFSQYSDEAVWSALRQSHLADFVSGLQAGLLHEVAEGGENLSVGQRQLICLARALLRKTKILVLDEATAAVDLETDDLIQTTIRSEFKGCTIITIAHRLNTVLDYDKILVLKEGQVAELDDPKTLMHREGSIFRAMCQDAGLV